MFVSRSRSTGREGRSAPRLDSTGEGERCVLEMPGGAIERRLQPRLHQYL